MRFKKRGHEPPWEEILKDLEDKEEGLSDQEWSERTLCIDETCIGVVGEDGICGVCRRDVRRDSIEEERMDEGPSGEDEGPSEEPAAAGESAAPHVDAEEDEGEIDSSERILCSDEACIGLVGTDGYCKLCDLRWKPSGYAEDETWVYRGDD